MMTSFFSLFLNTFKHISFSNKLLLRMRSVDSQFRIVCCALLLKLLPCMWIYIHVTPFMLETCFAGLNVKVWSLASENTHLTQALEFCHDFPAKFQTNCIHSTLDRKQVTRRTHRTDMCWPVDPFSVITSLNRISRWTLPCWPWGEETF